VRTADTGISAVVDGMGRVVASLGLDHRGVVDAPLPQPAGLTIFAIFGNAIPLLLAAATAVGAWRLYRYTC